MSHTAPYSPPSPDGSGTFAIVPNPAPSSVHLSSLDLRAARELAHDLRTPLSTISLNLEYLRDALRGTLSGEALEAVEDCLAACAQAVSMVADAAESSV